MQIDTLARHPKFVEPIVATLNESWGELSPWSNKSTIRARLESGATETGFPHTLVAIAGDGKLAATGSIKLNELPNHPEKIYWIGEIFVLPEYRNQGLGSRVTNALRDYAFANGAPAIYLYTPDQQSLYERLGWSEIGHEIANGEGVSVMVLRAGDSKPNTGHRR